MSQLAYLVIREGAKWSDVFRLVPGTVGHHRPRADEPDRAEGRALQPEPRRSVHVERPMDAPRSRKPQRHDGRQPDGPRRSAAEARRRHPHRPHAVGLRPQAFRRVHSVGRRRARWSGVCRPMRRRPRPTAAEDEANVLAAAEPTTITHRRGQDEVSRPRRRRAESGVSKMGRAAAKLCRLAFELAKAARRGGDGRAGPGGTGRRNADRRRRLAVVAGRRPRHAARRRPGSRRLAQLHRHTATIASRTSWPRP